MRDSKASYDPRLDLAAQKLSAGRLEAHAGKPASIWGSNADLMVDGGARGSHSSKTRRSVVQQMEQFRTDLRSGLAGIGRQPVLSEWLDYRLEHIIKPNRELTTYDLYEALVRRHIAPHLADVRLDRLHAETIERWLASLDGADVGLRTRQSSLLRLRTALNVAVQRGTNAAEHVEPPLGGKRSRRAAPSLDDARRLLGALDRSPLLRAFALLWLGQGLRRGETLGLRWDDIQFAGATCLCNEG